VPIDPLVACVCLVKGRPEMVKRAVASFCGQTYERKALLLWLTDEGSGSSALISGLTKLHPCILAVMNRDRGLTIGALRNEAAAWLMEWQNGPDIIAHWDSDDWSHPERLTEQVTWLQSSGAQVVGYNECLFWQEQEQQAFLYTRTNPRIAVGTSLLYWAGVWKQNHFPDLPTPGQPWSLSEDCSWMQQPQINLKSVSSIRAGEVAITAPRMIASIHGANTYAEHYRAMVKQGADLKRVPQWDHYCMEMMKL
jgi:Glycosyl transferase family 2